ncbi:MAG: amidohydrolase family protein [Chitinophagaceae bacterium]|nr:amidohydrolase family protein [Chitinophagaceae bacterium]
MNVLFSNITAAILFAVIFQACSSPVPSDTKPQSDSTIYYSANDFKTVKKTDAHVHVDTYDSAFIMQAKDDNFNLFTINWDDVNEPPPMEDQQKYALAHRKNFSDRLEYATTISIRKFNDKDWLDKTLSYIDNSVSHGAKAVKIYKVIGMTLRDKQGKLVMVDDPRFDSLFKYLEKNKIPVVGHLGEPRNCWLPVDSMTVKGDASYFTAFPQYHMYRHPELPSYEDQIRARDNRLAKNPNLTFVGAHLGSLEWNVDSLAARLDRYPNFAVDMAARIVHLEVQAKSNWQKVHDFLIKYNDRLLYATDLLIDEKMSASDARKAAHETWADDWKFFATDEKMTSSQFEGSFNGLKLPAEVIDNIYRNNAKKWLGIF